ncbi:hypothetical protein CY34DRAFT_511135 [Suillus luteus UH-Slu-Lm8-n1]|uniref:Unplaced genomic scaffold CY34scaffold_395, whole genome shotgun sequence n=1 Tax=Suillus luteus UH-Slu-Lm8-n1 TaxID=930992 RepID=A0A0C9ZGA9_9AGAM|nr:hypothetical protein CY34DRAFT_511135 [Suillus luteus UH-Slu-Lm8-n1]
MTCNCNFGQYGTNGRQECIATQAQLSARDWRPSANEPRSQQQPRQHVQNRDNLHDRSLTRVRDLAKDIEYLCVMTWVFELEGEDFCVDLLECDRMWSSKITWHISLNHPRRVSGLRRVRCDGDTINACWGARISQSEVKAFFDPLRCCVTLSFGSRSALQRRRGYHDNSTIEAPRAAGHVYCL